jgi:hypothetical protein
MSRGHSRQRRRLFDELVGECIEGPFSARLRDHEVVRGCSHGGAYGCTGMLNDPEVPLGIDLGIVDDRMDDPEYQVVASLIRKQEITGAAEKGVGVRFTLNVHHADAHPVRDGSFESMSAAPNQVASIGLASPIPAEDLLVVLARDRC